MNEEVVHNDEDWGYSISVDSDGVEHRTPLAPPAFSIPEEDREYIPTYRPGLVLWTCKREEEK